MNKKYTIWAIITLLFLWIGVFMYKNFNKTPEEIKVEHSLWTWTFLDTTHNSKFSKKETRFILSWNYELSNYERYIFKAEVGRSSEENISGMGMDLRME